MPVRRFICSNLLCEIIRRSLCSVRLYMLRCCGGTSEQVRYFDVVCVSVCGRNMLVLINVLNTICGIDLK